MDKSWTRAFVAGFVLLVTTQPGCIYSKHITNAHVRDLDSGRVVVGETTLLDVLHSWGPPPPLTALEFVTRGTDPKLFQPSNRYFRYVSHEMKCSSFLAVGPVPMAPIPVAPMFPFRWCDDQAAYALVLEFDDAGVVKRVTKGTTQVVWRPWSSGDDREISVQTTATPGVSLP
jgi:hypothetical protein